MAATPSADKHATHATPRIDFAIFDAAAKRAGANDETARAELVGVDRATLWRWRNGRNSPALDTAARIAETLGVSLNELTGRAA